MREELVCIICPIGCQLTVEYDGQRIVKVEGNRCKRGLDYAEQEIFHPERIVTTTVRVTGAALSLLPVRTDRGVARDLTLEIVLEASKISVEAPVKLGDILIRNILNTDADLIATRSLDKADHQ
ncbi:MAG TPA: DUF1667 domain-containing protein [Spirochaetia bacterium]|nr:DUF1667 domain-containing protein [Spirochaetia bacterium]